jgi:hypothetical protein
VIGLRTTNFDALAASVPLNRDASVVRDGSGEMFDKPIAGVRVERWLAPPPMKPPAVLAVTGDSSANLVGRRVGRVVVLGIWAEGNQNKKATWVCRCDCGYYEGLKRKTLGFLGENAACSHCQETDRLRAMASAPSTRSSRNKAAKRLNRMAASSRV